MTTAEVPCASCGKPHSPSELELGFKRPDAVVSLPDEQRGTDTQETDDLCAIRPDRYFVRGVLPLRVVDWDDNYCIGAWVEVERAVFDRVRELWDAPDQDQEPAFSATLANAIPPYAATLGLPVALHLTGPTSRPSILVPESEHPLYREQFQGISAHRADEYSTYF